MMQSPELQGIGGGEAPEDAGLVVNQLSQVHSLPAEPLASSSPWGGGLCSGLGALLSY